MFLLQEGSEVVLEKAKISLSDCLACRYTVSSGTSDNGHSQEWNL